MKLIHAKYRDMCLGCGGQIQPGTLVWWGERQTYHTECYDKESVVNKWLSQSTIARKIS